METFPIEDNDKAVQHLKSRAGAKPFRCRNLQVAQERFRHGSTTFEKGDLLCTKGFLSICSLFERAKADDKGRLVAKCRKMDGQKEVVFRKEK